MRLSTKTRQPNAVEQEAEHQAADEASEQLIRIPWRVFSAAYEDYPAFWLGLALWTRAICSREKKAPAIIFETLESRCPQFLQTLRLKKDPRPFDYELYVWIHEEGLRFARQGGWFEALFFFGNRHTLSLQAWEYCVACEEQWARDRPKEYPSCEQWWQSVREKVLYGETNASRVAQLMECYLDSQAFLGWIFPIMLRGQALPAVVLEEFQNRCPTFLEAERASGQDTTPSIAKHMRLFEHICRSQFGEALKEDWLKHVIRLAEIHPHGVRYTRFANHWRELWTGELPADYPSFHDWKSGADDYTEH